MSKEQKEPISATIPESTQNTPLNTPKTPRKYNYTKKTGRPTKYRKHYCQDIVEYFDQSPWTYEQEVIIRSKNGNEIIKHELKPKQLRFLNRWCMEIGINKDTLHLWVDIHPDFSEAYARAKELYKEHLAVCGSMGMFNSHFTQFLAKNTTDWSDKQVVEHEGKIDSTVFFDNMLSKAQQARQWTQLN